MWPPVKWGLMALAIFSRSSSRSLSFSSSFQSSLQSGRQPEWRSYLRFIQRRSRKKAFMHRMLSMMLLCRSTPSPRHVRTIPRWDCKIVKSTNVPSKCFIYGQSGPIRLETIFTAKNCCAVPCKHTFAKRVSQHDMTWHHWHLHLQTN